MQELVWFGQIILSAALGAIIGLQRERRGKSAGPRTYALVAVGATLFTILSLTVFAPTTASVASGVVSGIGFLGAGIIFRREDHIENLTTAAGLWAIAAIGMAVGARYFILASLCTLLMLVLLIFSEHRLFQK